MYLQESDLTNNSQSLRLSRVCLEDAVRHTSKRIVFGKPLIEQPVVRYKLSHMAYITNSLDNLIIVV
jgi:alkylation response protein AidB-like acyl-CoA dehydrogenase